MKKYPKLALCFVSIALNSLLISQAKAIDEKSVLAVGFDLVSFDFEKEYSRNIYALQTKALEKKLETQMRPSLGEILTLKSQWVELGRQSSSPLESAYFYAKARKVLSDFSEVWRYTNQGDQINSELKNIRKNISNLLLIRAKKFGEKKDTVDELLWTLAAFEETEILDNEDLSVEDLEFLRSRHDFAFAAETLEPACVLLNSMENPEAHHEIMKKFRRAMPSFNERDDASNLSFAGFCWKNVSRMWLRAFELGNLKVLRSKEQLAKERLAKETEIKLRNQGSIQQSQDPMEITSIYAQKVSSIIPALEKYRSNQYKAALAAFESYRKKIVECKSQEHIAHLEVAKAKTADLALNSANWALRSQIGNRNERSDQNLLEHNIEKAKQHRHESLSHAAKIYSDLASQEKNVFYFIEAAWAYRILGLEAIQHNEKLNYYYIAMNLAQTARDLNLKACISSSKFTNLIGHSTIIDDLNLRIDRLLEIVFADDSHKTAEPVSPL